VFIEISVFIFQRFVMVKRFDMETYLLETISNDFVDMCYSGMVDIGFGRLIPPTILEEKRMQVQLSTTPVFFTSKSIIIPRSKQSDH